MDPLDLSWRKLVVLLGGLQPNKSRLLMAVKLSDPMYLLDLRMGRPNVRRNYVAVDRFLESLNGD